MPPLGERESPEEFFEEETDLWFDFDAGSSLSSSSISLKIVCLELLILVFSGIGVEVLSSGRGAKY